MPEKAKHFSGFILDRAIQGEKFWRVVILTREYGARACLVRVAGKNKTTCVPDLFDEAEILLDKPKAGTDSNLRFAKEYRLVQRNHGISGNYKALVCACKFTTLLAKNAFSPDTYESVFKLCRNVLRAFGEKPNPDATYFKALWTLARENGYPVKEDWFEHSRFEEREGIANVLKTPLEQLEVDPLDLTLYTHRLESWLAREHHFIFDN